MVPFARCVAYPRLHQQAMCPPRAEVLRGGRPYSRRLTVATQEYFGPPRNSPLFPCPLRGVRQARRTPRFLFTL
jgi:hypothetical protein